MSLLGLVPALYTGAAAAILLGAVAAMTRFRSLHRLSVAVNAVQILALAYLWGWLTLN